MKKGTNIKYGAILAYLAGFSVTVLVVKIFQIFVKKVSS